MTSRIVTVFNQKGGCAKTMTTMQVAGEMGLRGLKVFVIDMDPQNTAALWYHQADESNPFPAEVLSMAPLKENFLDKIEPLANKFDVIIIDCPPALGSRVPWAALAISDLAIIPVIPVMDNVWASKQAEELVLEAQKSRAEKGDSALNAAYLFSMVRRGRIFDSCMRTLRAGTTIPILKSMVSMRNVFPESQVYGSVVPAFGKSAASDEIAGVVDEICKLIGVKAKPRKG